MGSSKGRTLVAVEPIAHAIMHSIERPTWLDLPGIFPGHAVVECVKAEKVLVPWSSTQLQTLANSA